MRAGVIGLFVAALLALSSAPMTAAADEPKKDPPKEPAKEPAKNEPTAGALASARSALREGLALREKGDTEGALARLQSAWDFVPTPITGFELGKTHLMLGHVLQAHELFAHVGRIPASMEESTRSQSARDESMRLMKEIEPRIPSLRIKLTLPPNATAEVKVDDEKLSVKGAETKLLVEVAESESKEVQLTPQWIPPAPKPVVGPSGQVVYVRTTNPLTFVGFGIAAASLLVTSISAVVFFNAREDALDRCGKRYCPPEKTVGLQQTGAVYDAEFDSAKGRYLASGFIMVVGAVTTVVFGGIGAVFAVRPVKERVTAGPTFAPRVGLGGAGLQGTF